MTAAADWRRAIASAPRRWLVAAQLPADLIRSGSTTVGRLLPLIVFVLALAAAATVFGQVVVPWVIYPAL